MKTFKNTKKHCTDTGIGEQGIAAVEGLFMMLVFLAIAFGIVEFGSMIHAQTTVTHIAREGGNLASRDINAGNDLLDLLAASSSSLDFAQNPGDYKIFLVSVQAGDATDNAPSCDTVFQRGTLSGNTIRSPQVEPNCGLTPELATYLTHDGTLSAIERLTVVRVYYHHAPLTPLGRILAAPMFSSIQTDVGDIVMTSQSIF
ncbi:TadE/TadG family type IV pilus assembly protein [Candidatus Nitrospira salsa]